MRSSWENASFLDSLSSEQKIEFLLTTPDSPLPIPPDVNKDKYVALRQQLLSNHSIKQYLPQIINDCRKPLDFWDYIKTEFDSYAERRQYLRKEFSSLYIFLESKSSSYLEIEELFKRQFSLGMPFGIYKPSLPAIPDKGTQKIYFEETKEIGLIKDNVYPNFSFSKLQ